MNKQKFLKLLNDCKNIPEEDIQKLRELELSYPFSQVIHSLVAKSSHDIGAKDANRKISVAAMYTTDRAVLKNLIEDKLQTKHIPKDNAGEATQQETPQHNGPQPIEPDLQEPANEERIEAADTEDQGEELRNEVLKNLELLMQSKKPYSKGFEEKQNLQKAQTPSKDKKEKSTKKTLAPESTPPLTEENTVAEETKAPQKKKKEIKHKQKEQIDIIDKFIKTEPSIKKFNLKNQEEASSKDLSQHSSEFGEDLVSETLAKILVKQGKKAKAIDIYKKLIWKFPQKRAYFASLIEKLKN